MHIHPDRLAAVTNDRIINVFTSAKPRRLELGRLTEIGINNSQCFILKMANRKPKKQETGKFKSNPVFLIMKAQD